MINLIALLQAPAATPGNRGLIITVVYVLSFGMIAYFILIRPQQRIRQQHMQMMSALKKGDEVMTEGGIIGTIVHITEDRVTLKSGDTRLVVARAKIGRILTDSAAGTT